MNSIAYLTKCYNNTVKEGRDVRHPEHGGPILGKRSQRIPLNLIASSECIIAAEQILEIHYPCSPRDNAEAAAAHHQPAEPSVQRPQALPSILIHPPPQIQHPPARPSAHTKRRNLLSKALQGERAAAQNGSSCRGTSYRHAAAGAQSFKPNGQGPVSRIPAGIGPEGVGHEAGLQGNTGICNAVTWRLSVREGCGGWSYFSRGRARGRC